MGKDAYRELEFLNGTNGFVVEEKTMIALVVLPRLQQTKMLKKPTKLTFFN